MNLSQIYINRREITPLAQVADSRIDLPFFAFCVPLEVVLPDQLTVYEQ